MGKGIGRGEIKAAVCVFERGEVRGEADRCVVLVGEEGGD